MKRYLKSTVVTSMLTIMLSQPIAFAANEHSKNVLLEKSGAFSEWEQLSLGETKNIIEPSYN